MKILLVTLLVIALGLLLLTAFLLSVSSFVRALALLVKKTNNPLPSLLVTFGILGIIFWLLYWASIEIDWGQWSSLKYFLVFIISCLISHPVVVKAGPIIKHKEKVPFALTAGPRKSNIPFKLLGNFCIGIALVSLTVVILRIKSQGTPKGGFPFQNFIVPSFLVGVMFRKYPKLYRQQPLNEQELNLLKNYVLFLRGFENEKYVFYYGRHLSEMGNTLSSLVAMNYTTAYPFTFEAFMAHQLKLKIGELVGLGNPSRPYPYEIAKMIYTLGDWQSKLDGFLKGARCIIVLPSLTEGLQYELKRIVALELSYKTVICTPPAVKGRLRRWLFKFMQYTNPFEGAGAAQWQGFQPLLQQVGFRSAIVPVGGTVIGFDLNNEAKVIKTDCQKPSDYVMAICGYLQNNVKNSEVTEQNTV